jgi:dTDP-4-amino-4,6-dideoxygalactose transaminase
MFFVHPQIKVNLKNLKKIISGIFDKSKEQELIKKLQSRFPGKKLVFTDMGRTAFKVIIEKYNLADSKIAMPAYICDIFYTNNTLKKYNIKPVFIKADKNTLNMDLEDLRGKLDDSIKAIFVAHTYGLQIDIKKIRAMAGNKLIIEDCAHSFGAKYSDGTYVGNLGNVSFFSLYKQIPSFRGGLLVCPKEWDINLTKTKFSFRDIISFLNCFPIFAFLFKTFGSQIAQKTERQEKYSEPHGINRISVNFFHNFLDDFESSLAHRISLATLFQKELEKLDFKIQSRENNNFCYLSALAPEQIREKRDILVHVLRKNGIFANRIWHTPIIMNKEVKKEYDINLNSFPNTTDMAKRVINFPLQNYYTKADIGLLIKNLKKALLEL